MKVIDTAAYARLWEQNGPPDVFRFLAENRTADVSEILVVLLCDQQHRWQTPAPHTVEDYLQRLPVLQSDPDAKLQLAIGEFRARQQTPQPPTLEEFQARFNDISGLLAWRLADLSNANDDDTQPTRAMGADTDDFSLQVASAPLAAEPPSPVGRPVAADVPSTIDGRYEVRGELGSGGMAVVYRAYDTRTTEDVALKLMKSNLQGSARRRFLREFNTISAIDHPYCLRVHEIGEIDSGPYFTMELHPGRPIDFLNGQPAELTAPPLVDVTLALDHIHAHGIVHRDVKPSNILVRSVGLPDGGQRFEAKLMDFGLARYYQIDSSVSRDAGFVGTAAYCAPEQIDHRDVDHRVDLYLLGLLAYELLSGGRHPFAAARATKQIGKILNAQLNEHPAPLGEVNPALPHSVVEAVECYLHKDAQLRPNSAAVLRRALCDAYGIRFDEQLEAAATGAATKLNAIGFVCRNRELQAIDDYLHHHIVDAGGAAPRESITVVNGEPGIGKSCLMREGSRKARALGCQVYEGRCFDGNRAPFQPFIEIIREILSNLRQNGDVEDEKTGYLGAVPTGEIATQSRAIVEEYSAELLRIAPDLRRWLPGEAFSQVEFAGGADYIFRAIASFFIELSTVQPLCLCIDDLQWADPSSLDLLKHLAEGLQASRAEQADAAKPRPQLAVLCTARTGHRRFSTFLSQLESVGRVLSLNLAQFDSRETAQLVALRLNCHADDIDAELVNTVDAFCRGNAFFISETIREWHDRGNIARGKEGWRLIETRDDESSLPGTVRDALRGRLFGLSDGARKLLEPAAVIGAIVDLDVLGEVVSDLPEDELLDEIDELVQNRVFLETRNAARVQFAHDLLREMVLEDLSANRARVLHRRVAELLEQRRESNRGAVPAAVLAEHCRAAQEHDKAFAYFMEAARNSLDAYAFADALKQLSAAEELLPEDVDAPTRSLLYEMFGETHARLLHLEESDAAFEKALEYATDPLSRGKVYLGIAKNMQDQNQFIEAVEAYDASLEALGFKRPRGKLRRLLDINWSAMQILMLPRWCMRSIRSDDHKRRAEVACESLYRLAHITIAANVWDYVQVCMKNAAVAKAAESPAAISLSYSKFSFNLCLSGVYLMGKRFAKIAHRAAEECGQSYIEKIARQSLGSCYYLAGELDVAEKELRRVLPVFERTHDWFYEGLDHHFLRHVYSVRGDAAQTIHSARTEISCAERTGNQVLRGWGYYGLTHGLALGGQLEEAAEAAQMTIDLLEGTTMRGISYQEQGFARMQASDYEGAVASFEAALECMWNKMTYFELNMYAYPRMAEALLGPYWADESRQPSGRQFKLARRMARKAGWLGRVFPNIHAHSLRILGRVAYVRGRHKKARRYFERAIERASKLGARYDEARALLDIARAFPAAGDHRQRGEQILEELGAVIPEIEREQFPA